MALTKVTKVALEALHDHDNPEAWVTQCVLELLQKPSPPTRVTQANLEIIQKPIPPVWVTQCVVEVLRAGGFAYTDGGGDHLVNYGY